MTVKTTIEFLADVGGAIDAGVEATQTALLRAHTDQREDVERLLGDALAKLRAAKELVKPTIRQQRNPL